MRPLRASGCFLGTTWEGLGSLLGRSWSLSGASGGPWGRSWSPLPPPAGLVGNVTGFPFSPLFRSQTYPKPIFVRFVFLRCFCFVLACFWDAFGIHFGRPNRPNLGQVVPKTAFGTIFLEQHECSRNIGRRSVWSVSRAPREHPKRPKIGPRRPQANLKE